MSLVHFLGPDGELVPVSAADPLPIGAAAPALAALAQPPEAEPTNEGAEEL
ncbi:hypothetical protein [Micromonospora deserti]|uniref:hypothetical protein n=1 Tax=Micromonospora deserti TaxID=2070366 RepID=UPI001314C4B8|nr:hypothetical protein [Micromonospora deserti]